MVNIHGKHSRILREGCHILFPFESIKKFAWLRNVNGSFERSEDNCIPLNKTTLEFDMDCVFTNDKLITTVRARLVCKINDPHKIAYEYEDFLSTVQTLAKACVMETIHKYGFFELSTMKCKIDNSLEHAIADVADEYGLKIKSFEIVKVLLDDRSLSSFNKIVDLSNEETVAKNKKKAEIEACIVKKNAQLAHIDKLYERGFSKEQIYSFVTTQAPQEEKKEMAPKKHWSDDLTFGKRIP
jgi:regulator of protease activity HflC (stomatin/prohibitin superfamily)